MKYGFFYLLTVLIWGTTWIGIKLQLGSVDPVASVLYRFSLAALILLAWCRLRRLPMRYGPGEHVFMFLQGVLLFGFNYLLFYVAELHIASGLAAVIFATILPMNIVNGALFLRTKIDYRVVVGGVLGLTGIVLVFRHEVSSFSLANNGFLGAILCVAATFLASLGNIVSARNQAHQLPIVQTNAYGMGYGAVAMLACCFVLGVPFGFEATVAYAGSLLYLALFGSVIAFGCYLSLIGSIGADRAAYATLLFPVVALTISTIWEQYQWTWSAAAGVSLILIGNLLILRRRALGRNDVGRNRNKQGANLFNRHGEAASGEM